MRRFHIISCVALALLLGSCAKPSAETLVERFRAQKSTFESFAQSMPANADDYTKAYFGDPDFRNAMDQLNVRSMFIADQCYILITPKTNNILPTHIEKGYAFLCEEPESLVTDIDNYDKNAPWDGVYQHIEDQWYLYVRRTP